MALKKIVLHTAAIDNAGNWHDAGSELEIADKIEPGSISRPRAEAMIDNGGAVSVSQAAAEEKVAGDVKAD